MEQNLIVLSLASRFVHICSTLITQHLHEKILSYSHLAKITISYLRCRSPAYRVIYRVIYAVNRSAEDTWVGIYTYIFSGIIYIEIW